MTIKRIFRYLCLFFREGRLRTTGGYITSCVLLCMALIAPATVVTAADTREIELTK